MGEEMLSLRETAKKWYDCWFAFEELYALWAKKHGVNTTVMFCLYAIHHSEKTPTPGGLAAALRLSKQTINSALDILEKKGCLTRTVAPQNRRSRLIHLTPQGQALADEMMESFFAFEEKIFGVLSPRDRKSLERLTQRLHYGIAECGLK